MAAAARIVAGLLGAFAVVAIAGAAAWLDRGAVVDAGSDETAHRELLAPIRAIPRSRLRPLVVFFGDSTLVERDSRASFAAAAGARLAGEADVLVVARSGLDPFHYYGLAGALQARSPEVVVIVANRRVLTRPLPRWHDLLSALPAAELPRALALPLHERGITLPRLLLYQALDAPGVDRAWAGLLGARTVALERTGLAPIAAPRTIDLASPRARRATFVAYAAPVHARLPTLRLLVATVALLERRGSAAVVVALPVPIRRLAEHGLHDAAGFDRGTEQLRASVEGAGGTFVDLQAAVPAAEFLDDFGHMSTAGAARVARRLLPTLRAELGR